MKKAAFGIFLVILFIAAIFLGRTTVKGISGLVKRNNHLETANDSIVKENATLKNLLKEKLVSHCDTVSAETKLKLAKLEEYKIYLQPSRDRDESRAYQEKEDTEMKIYNEKEAEDMKFFERYRQEDEKFWQGLETENRQAFQNYIILCFKDDHSSENSQMTFFRQKQEMEKLPIIAKYLSASKTAWWIRDTGGHKLEIIYAQKKAVIGKTYSIKMQAIATFYGAKINAKKLELGL